MGESIPRIAHRPSLPFVKESARFTMEAVELPPTTH